MIYYNGAKYTQKEFLEIMRYEYPDMVAWKFKGIPLDPQRIKKNDLAKWVEFSGATFVKGSDKSMPVTTSI
jgi:hypothetical protein